MSLSDEARTTLPELAHLAEAGGAAFFDPFALHARLDFDLNDRKTHAVNFPVLLHEYTHYLQSISTVYGLYRVLDWIRTGVRLSSVLPSLKEIRIPLLSRQRDDGASEALRVQLSEIAVRLKLNSNLEQPVPIDGTTIERIGPLQISRVQFSDGEPHIMACVPVAGGKAIPIGARALSEGMAASVQRIWETVPRIDAVLAALSPEDAGWYSATRDLIGQIVRSSADNDWINAFICDVAMMTRNPPASFIAAVVAMIDANSSSKEVIAECVRGALQELIDEEIAETRRDIAGILDRLADSDEPFAQAVRRLLTTSDELLARRSSQPGFPIDVLCGDRPGELQPLLLDRYPLPCYFSGDTLQSWHEDEVLLRLGKELLMMEHVMRILLFGRNDYNNACPLTESSSCDGKKSLLCGREPWRIGIDADGMICAFVNAMQIFDAVGKVVG